MISKINKFITTLFFLFLNLLCILTIIDYCCFDKDFYLKEYKEINLSEQIGVSDHFLSLMTDDLLDYMKGDKEDLSLEILVNNTRQEAFNKREKLHMFDVKILYENVIFIRDISILLCLILLTLIIINKDYKYFKKGFIISTLLFIMLFIFIGIFCLIDFNTFWTDFHHIFFTKNDYWLLNPQTDLLINMVPSKFFFDLCIRILIFIFIYIFILFIIISFINKRIIKND